MQTAALPVYESVAQKSPPKRASICYQTQPPETHAICMVHPTAKTVAKFFGEPITSAIMSWPVIN